MNTPKFILKDCEAVYVDQVDDPKMHNIKRAVWIIVGIIIIGSFVLGENLFGELSWTVRILLILLCVGTLFSTHREKEPFPIEIRFYDDYLEIYREKRYYSGVLNNVFYRNETAKFFYADIKQIQYRTQSRRMNFIGVFEGTYYTYNKDGSLPKTPSYHKKPDGIFWFCTDFLECPNIVGIIEEYCPVKVTVENN